MSRVASESPDVAVRRRRLVALCLTLPEAETETAGATHLSFKVRGRTFGYYCNNHHGDGVIALWCKAPPGEQGRLVSDFPHRYFVPPYVGPRGWVGLRLDTRAVGWTAVKDLLFGSYYLTAPNALRKDVDRVAARRSPREQAGTSLTRRPGRSSLSAPAGATPRKLCDWPGSHRPR